MFVAPTGSEHNTELEKDDFLNRNNLSLLEIM